MGHDGNQVCTDPPLPENSLTPTIPPPLPDNKRLGKSKCCSCGRDNLSIEIISCPTSGPAGFSSSSITTQPLLTTQSTADVNGDGIINGVDFSLCLVNYWKRGENITGDINKDNIVNSLDTSIIIPNFGKRVK
jgi:hypothetical protein